MTDTFTASNGVNISIQPPQTDRGPWLMVDGHMTSPNDATALREFFRHEEDERLGRWRWLENTDYVVYPEQPGTEWVRVICESQALMARLDRQKACHDYVDRTVHQNAARAFFDAHPEPKPWHDATPGDFWEITFSDVGGGGTELWKSDGVYFTCVSTAFNPVRLKDSTIIAGEKIYPKETS